MMLVICIAVMVEWEIMALEVPLLGAGRVAGNWEGREADETAEEVWDP